MIPGIEREGEERGRPRSINKVYTREGAGVEETKQALVFVDVRNPRLIGTWDDLGSGVQIPGPLNPGWGYSKRWGDSRDWDDEDAAWEGSMGERKAEYYAKHLETLVESEAKLTGLPTLLARMVNEFHQGLTVESFSSPIKDSLAIEFNRALVSAAQPLLAEYLNKLANPPMVVKKQDDEAGLPIMVRAVLAAERQRAEEALALVRAGKGVPAARKHLGLDEEDKQLAYREFCARLTLTNPNTPTPSLEEWAAARKHLGLE